MKPSNTFFEFLYRLSSNAHNSKGIEAIPREFKSSADATDIRLVRMLFQNSPIRSISRSTRK